MTARSVNSHRDRLRAAYARYQDDVLRITLNPFTFKRFEENYRHLRTSFEAVAAKWPQLLAALPDDRARLFVSLVFRLGWREGEPLGLEWGHFMRTTQGTWVVRKEQQRKMWLDVPRGLKHDGKVGTFELHPEAVRLLFGVRRALEKGERLLGCARGSLVGTRPCKDAAVRSFVFPYREEHLQVLMQCLRAVLPEEFPKGQAWHRLRRACARHVGTTQSFEATNRLLGHKTSQSTDAYLRDVVGVSATGEDVRKLYASQDEKMVSLQSHGADTIFQGSEQ